jgi:hypothetical protein
MKVAYIFATSRHSVSYVLAKMILPQLEQDRHGADVVGMFFFEDNNYVLMNNPIGERLHKVAQLRARDCRQAVRRRADRLLSGPLQSIVRQYAGSSHHRLRPGIRPLRKAPRAINLSPCRD